MDVLKIMVEVEIQHFLKVNANIQMIMIKNIWKHWNKNKKKESIEAIKSVTKDYYKKTNKQIIYKINVTNVIIRKK